MLCAVFLIPRKSVQTDGVYAFENALFDVRIISFEPPNQRFDLLPLGTSAAVVAGGAVFGKASGALDEFKIVVPLPRKNIILVNAV